MEEQAFRELLGRAGRGEAKAVLAAVDAEPGLASRAATSKGETLLIKAVIGKSASLVRGLLTRGARVDAKAAGWNALMWAVNAGSVRICKLLLDRGADPNTRDHQWTALGRACFCQNFKVCLLLISRGADLRPVMHGAFGGGGGGGGQARTAVELYGERDKTIRPVDKKMQCDAILEAWEFGPHADMRWQRRWPFVRVLVCCDFQPTAARRAVLAVLHPPLPPDAVIPRLPCETLAQRRALLRDKIFTHPALWRKVASFL